MWARPGPGENNWTISVPLDAIGNPAQLRLFATDWEDRHRHHRCRSAISDGDHDRTISSGRDDIWLQQQCRPDFAVRRRRDVPGLAFDGADVTPGGVGAIELENTCTNDSVTVTCTHLNAIGAQSANCVLVVPRCMPTAGTEFEMAGGRSASRWRQRSSSVSRKTLTVPEVLRPISFRWTQSAPSPSRAGNPEPAAAPCVR